MRHDTLGWLRSAIWAIFLLIAATYSQGQGTPYTGVALGQNQSGTVQIVPMATIQVCAYSATNSCPTPLVGALFGSKTLAPASAMSNPFFADSSGNFTFYAAPNFYTCLVSGPFGSGIGSYSFPCPTPPDSSIFRDGVGFANFGALYFDGTRVTTTGSPSALGTFFLCSDHGAAPSFICPPGAVTWSSNINPVQDLTLGMGLFHNRFTHSGNATGDVTIPWSFIDSRDGFPSSPFWQIDTTHSGATITPLNIISSTGTFTFSYGALSGKATLSNVALVVGDSATNATILTAQGLETGITNPEGATSRFPASNGVGCTIFSVYKMNYATGKITPTITTDTTNGEALGICTASNPTNPAWGVLVTSGNASCTCDNAATIGDWIVISSTVNGNCHSAGATIPASPNTILGRSTTTGTGIINLFLHMQIR